MKNVLKFVSAIFYIASILFLALFLALFVLSFIDVNMHNLTDPQNISNLNLFKILF